MTCLYKFDAQPYALEKTMGQDVVFIRDEPSLWARENADFAPFRQYLTQLPNVFFQPDYLSALAFSAPRGMAFGYLFFQKKGQIVGFAPCQIKDVKAAESFSWAQTGDDKASFKRILAQCLNFQTFVLGNLSLTGENSYYFDNQIVTLDERAEFLKKGIETAKAALAESQIFIKTTFLKDFYAPQMHLNTEGYNQFQVEPNFIMPLDAAWHRFDDYLDALSSKYRVRAKRAFKKMTTLESVDLTEEQIGQNAATIHNLYRQIAQKSDFNLVDFTPQYFPALKKALGERLILRGYFLEGKLVGFCSAIINGAVLEAHFLGYEQEVNTTTQLYLNMLFDFIKMGITHQLPTINFGRTAHEIKSSVGAIAHDMYLYLKHDNLLINRLLPHALPILSPREKWQPRQPFK